VKQCWPAPERNRAPLLAVLRTVLPAQGTVVEVASGSGQHAAFFAGAMSAVTWQPSDVDAANLASIESYVAESRLSNLRSPVVLDAAEPETWPIERADAVFNANMIHIAPWQACLGLLRGAAAILPAGAPLCLYGPYFIRGRETASSNTAFDQSLRARNSAWGVRWLHDVEAEAEAVGLTLDRVTDMPANNVTVVFRRLG